MAAVATAAPPPAPAGKQRNLGLMILWMLLTFNIYWLFWLYKVYKEVRAHSSKATTVTPGFAVGLLFIPIFGIFWFIRIVVDFPRAIRRMQQDDPMGEPLLPNAAVSTLLLVGFVLNCLSFLYPALALLGWSLMLSGFLLAQSALNQHWQRHSTGPLPASAAQVTTLGQFLGARGTAFAIGPAVAFLLAWLLCELPSSLLPVFSGGSPRPTMMWVAAFIGAAIQTALVVAALRIFASDFLAVLLASLTLPLVSGVVDTWIRHILPPIPRFVISVETHVFLEALLPLLALAVMLRIMRYTWLAIWIGAIAGFLLREVAFTVLGVLGESSYDLFPPLRSLVVELAAATIFAFVFWGGAKLMRRGTAAA
jgi:hypothetical protein